MKIHVRTEKRPQYLPPQGKWWCERRAGGRQGPVMQDLPRHGRGVWVFSAQGEAMGGFKQEATWSTFQNLEEWMEGGGQEQ